MLAPFVPIAGWLQVTPLTLFGKYRLRIFPERCIVRCKGQQFFVGLRGVKFFQGLFLNHHGTVRLPLPSVKSIELLSKSGKITF